MWSQNTSPWVWVGLLIGITYGWSDNVWPLRLGYKRHCGFFLALSPAHFLWRKPATMLWGYSLRQPNGEVHVIRNGGPLPTANKEWGLLPTAVWTYQILEADSLALVKPSDDSIPSDFLTAKSQETLSQVTWLDLSSIFYPFNLWDDKC